MDHPVVNFIALMVLTVYSSIPVVLIVAHMGIKLWRKLGRLSFAIFILMFAVLIGASAWIVVANKATILSWRLYDTPWALPGILIWLTALWLEIKTIKTLSFKTLMGLPEILPAAASQQLIVSGPYRFVRHPRYLEFILELLAAAVVSGLGVNYLLFLIFIPFITWAARLEERELVSRFGQTYIDYKKRTSMFLPKIKNI